MMYRVMYSDGVLRQISDHVHWLKQEGAPFMRIESWFSELFEQIDDLNHMPRR